MSYHIVYTSSEIHNKPNNKGWKFTAAVIVIVAILGIVFQNSAVMGHALPMFREEVRVAFFDMLENIKNGVPVGEATVVFGQTIIFA